MYWRDAVREAVAARRKSEGETAQAVERQSARLRTKPPPKGTGEFTMPGPQNAEEPEETTTPPSCQQPRAGGRAALYKPARHGGRSRTVCTDARAGREAEPSLPPPPAGGAA